MAGGLHLEVFDFSRAQTLAEEARELGQSLRWPQAVVSAGIDLLLNFARRGEVERTEALVDEVAEAAATTQGVHGWIWRLRFAAAQGEIALARGEWEAAVRAAEDAIAQSQQRGRVKYHALGLEIRAKALAALGHKQESIVGLRKAVALARLTGDPVLFLHAASALLAIDGDDALLAEARTRVERIAAALPDAELIRRFMAAEPVRFLMR
jgi:tetratricopeptide (TPR) repeat protein